MAINANPDRDLERGKRFVYLSEIKFPKLSRAKIGVRLGGYTESAVRSWEAGVGLPNKALVALIEDGVSLNWLLAGKGELRADQVNSNENSPPATTGGDKVGVNQDLVGQCLVVQEQLARVARHLLGDTGVRLDPEALEACSERIRDLAEILESVVKNDRDHRIA